MPRPILRVLSAAVCAALAGTTATATATGAERAAAPTGSDAASTPVSRCETLRGVTVPAARIGLRTRGATITSVAELTTPATGNYCQVTGEIHPVDRSSSPIRFQVNLPARWNRRSLLLGGGGANGTVVTGLGQVPAGPSAGPTPLAQGYVTYGSDSGHQAGPATSRDGRFALNDEALRNFSGDALKKTHDVAMRLVAQRYDRAPRYRYVAGGSTGGREALLAASRWPRDFDGALVLYPAWNAVALNLEFGRMTRQLAKPGAYPSPAKRTALFAAAVQTCDGLDGVRDGVISNQKRCDQVFDPARARVGRTPLRCAGGKDAGPNCLSDEQIRSFRTLDAPSRLPYRLANGERGYPGFTTWGTDFGRVFAHPLQTTVVSLSLGLVQPASPMPPVLPAGSPPYGSTFWDEWVRFAVTRDPGFDALSLDPAHPGRWRSRIVELSRLQEVDPRGLRTFARRGGKVLMAHGVHDALVSNRATRQLMGRLEADLGPRLTRRAVRYYEIPGYGHAVSTVFNAEWDSLPALTRWVERGRTPGAQVVTDRVGVPTGRTRPLCEYPTWPRYVRGDVDSARSFRCVR
ncbi:tannase/feruloyl esterase family alpha/beta hydrolase [Agilicoccus flavus]|uniref:tannase/feruloyl esterase family alpha/beta hydrolase n=1 Tax=Agilicoccus flavus TaxID=2775968 RepID=UPI001CF66E14|nr:tannase/feruloyl esterase family alpha/beta hydrolase [Agilicoccus flavus]